MTAPKDDATWVNPSGHPKPRKHGPKQYKLAAGPTGADRLSRRVNSLLLAASRLARKATDDTERQWAERLVETLKAFNATEFARTTPFDVQTLIDRKDPT